MRDDERFDIRVNGVPRTFRDRKQPAYGAPPLIKRKAKNDIVEIVDRSTGKKMVMLADERTA